MLRWPLRVHAALLLALLLALLPLVHSGTVGYPDEGSYVAQARNLTDGSWASERPLVDLDPDGERDATLNGSVDGSRVVPYARHPLYPLLLTPFHAVGGLVGTMLLSLLGSWVAALCGALVARRIDPRLAVPSLWVLGVGTPLLFDAYLVIAHSVGAACFGLAVVALWRAVPSLADARPVDGAAPRTRALDGAGLRWGWLAASAAAGAVAVGVRTEAAIAVLALAAATALVGLRGDPDRSGMRRWARPRPSAAETVAACALVAAVGVALVVDAWAAARLTSGLETTSLAVQRDANAWSAAWITLLRPWHQSMTRMTPTGVLVFACAVLAPLMLRLLPRRPVVSVALLWSAAIASVAHQWARTDLISGLFAAAPVVTTGILLLRRRDLQRRPVALLAVTSALTTAGILATTYSEGGVAEWGGRFFHVLLPVLVPLAVLGLDRGRAALPGQERRLATIALVVLTASTGVLAVRAMAQQRLGVERLVTATTAREQRLSPAGERVPIVVSGFSGTGVSRFFLDEVAGGARVVNARLPDLFRTVEDADRLGYDRLVLVFNGRAATLEYFFAEAVEGIGWSIEARDVPRNPMFSIAVLERDPSGG